MAAPEGRPPADVTERLRRHDAVLNELLALRAAVREATRHG